MFRRPASPLINSPWRWTRSTSRGSPLLHTLPQVDHDDDDDQYSYDVKMMIWGIGFCAQCDAHIFAAKALERPLAPWWWGGDQHCCIIAIFHHNNHIHIIISISWSHSEEMIWKARRLRKALGGGMRQTGVIHCIIYNHNCHFHCHHRHVCQVSPIVFLIIFCSWYSPWHFPWICSSIFSSICARQS